jgi:23S rRNA pseudouridine1911/1915/1917 synthase
LPWGIDWLPSEPAQRIPVTPPEILFEDDFLVAFDKPSGLPVSPDRSERARATLMGLVRGSHGQSLACVHRLDRDTSGIVLCAKTKPALDFLSGQFQSKSARRVYLALVSVLPPERAGAAVRDAAGVLPHEFSVDLALGQDERDPGRVRVFRRGGGRPSVTEFRILESFGRFAWLECRPLTGRMHQIRVHLASAGAPVTNDGLYGDPGSVLLLSGLKRMYKGLDSERPLVSRLALHARSLAFVHPASREPVEIAAPVPKDLEVALKYLRKFAGSRRGGR